MKKITKLFAILLALLMAVTSLTACKKEEENGGEKPSSSTQSKKKEKNNDKADVEEAVSAYLDAVFGFDFEEAAKYVSDDEKDTIESIDIMEGIEEVEEYGLTEKDVNKIFDKLSDKLTYEILDIEVDGDEAEVTVEASAVEDIGDLEDYVDFDEETAMMMLIEKMGYSSMEDFETAANNGDVSEEDMIPYIGEVIMDIAFEAIDNIELDTQEQTIKLEKNDGEWIIVVDDIAGGFAK